MTPESSSRGRSSPWWWLSDVPAGASLTTTVPWEGRPQADDATLAESWKPGDIIADLYEVREVFTSGGRGLVYRVRHRGWNMDLAVKCPRPECFLSEQDKADFEQEAETWVKLGLHPHLVTCYYVRRLGGIPRVFAEFVSGGSLAEWIRSRQLYAVGPKRSQERILDLAIQIAWGLQHAHEQGLIHRDVKPGNVLLTDDGIAKVTDFGMAKARGASAARAAATGQESVLVSAGGLTPAFCSPEQVQGRPVSRKTDIWSWGVSLLHAFSGSAHWSAGYLAAGVLADYLERGPAESILPPMPQGLAELLRQCFQPNPDDRPRDMREIATVLQRLYGQITGRPYRRESPRAAKALAESLNNRALSLRDLHKNEEAEQLWQEALTSSPQHPESTYNLGLTRWRAGRLPGDALVQQLRDVCTATDGAWLPPYLLARVQLEQGDWRAVAETLQLIQGVGSEVDEIHAANEAARKCLAEGGRRVRQLTGHSGWVSSVSASRAGRTALSGGAGGALMLWSVPTGRCLRTLQGHTEWVTSVSLSGNGGLALSGSADRTLKLWRTGDGQCLRTFEGHTNWVLAAALSGDGQWALSGGGEGAIKLWDTATGDCLCSLDGHEGSVLAVCWSGDGRLGLSGSRDHTARLWDTSDGQCLRNFAGHTDKVLSVALSGDGQLALSGSADRTIKLWETSTGRCLRTFEGHQGGVTAVCFSAGGCYVLSGSEDRTIKLWQRTTGRCLLTLEGHAGTVHSLCLASGGRQLLSASADATLALWALPGDHVAPYVLSRVLPSDTALAAWTDYVRSLARARRALQDGDAVSAARNIREARSRSGHGRRPEAMDLWASLYVHLPRRDLQGGWSGADFAEHSEAVTSVCLSADGQLALSGSADRTLKLWRTATGECLQTLESDMGGVTSVCLSGDGRRALSGSTDAALKLWDVAEGSCLLTCREDLDVLTSVALGSDGRSAVSASTDGTVHVWDAEEGRLLRVLRIHTGPVHSLALSADGRYALSGSALFVVRNDGERIFTSGQLKMWEPATGRCLQTFDSETDAVTAVCLSADSRFALTGGGESIIQRDSGRFAQSGPVHLWELASGRRLRTFTGHTGAVTSVCLSFDGGYALSGSTDATVKLWDVAGGHCLRTFAGHADAVTSVAFSADGRYALSGSADRTLKLWVLDWELEDRTPADWDDGALPYLQTFLLLHNSVAARPEAKRSDKKSSRWPLARLFRSTAGEEENNRNDMRSDRPRWSERDFQGLLRTLGYAGFGWLRPEGVRRRLERMARHGKGD